MTEPATPEYIECKDCHAWVRSDAMALHHVKRWDHAGVKISDCEDRRISSDGP